MPRYGKMPFYFCTQKRRNERNPLNLCSLLLVYIKFLLIFASIY